MNVHVFVLSVHLSGIFGSSCSALDVQVAFFFLYHISVQTQVNTTMKTKKKTENVQFKWKTWHIKMLLGLNGYSFCFCSHIL